MTAPLSEERLAEIGRRHATTTGGHWRFDPDGCLGPGTVVSESGGYEHMVGSLDFGEGLYADHDRDFVMSAREDMADLLVDNARLRAQVALMEEDSATLRALEAGGVDNWDGYSDAMAEVDL